MGRSDKKAKAPIRRAVSESATPSRGQRKRALKKASLISKIGLTKRARNNPEVGWCFVVLSSLSHLMGPSWFFSRYCTFIFRLSTTKRCSCVNVCHQRVWQRFGGFDGGVGSALF